MLVVVVWKGLVMGAVLAKAWQVKASCSRSRGRWMYCDRFVKQR